MTEAATVRFALWLRRGSLTAMATSCWLLGDGLAASTASTAQSSLFAQWFWGPCLFTAAALFTVAASIPRSVDRMWGPARGSVWASLAGFAVMTVYGVMRSIAWIADVGFWESRHIWSISAVIASLGLSAFSITGHLLYERLHRDIVE